MILWTEDGNEIELDEIVDYDYTKVFSVYHGPDFLLEAWQCGCIRKYKLLISPCRIEDGATLIFDRKHWWLTFRYYVDEEQVI